MKEFLARLARRARFVAARESFLDAFFWSSYAAASLLVADRIRLEFVPGARPYSDLKSAMTAIGASLVLSLVVAAIRAARTNPGDADLARAADRSLGLSDRIATAVEQPAGLLAPLVRRQAEDGIVGAVPGKVLPAPPAGARRWALAAVLAAAILALFPLHEPPNSPSSRSIHGRRPRAGADIADEPEGETGSGGSTGAGSAVAPEGDPSSSTEQSGGGRPSPPPPLFGDPERTKFKERPEFIAPLVGEGAWKPSAGLGVDAGAAAAGAPDAATDPERLAAYRRQAEAVVGRDGFPETDRAIVKGYFERVAPAK